MFKHIFTNGPEDLPTPDDMDDAWDNIILKRGGSIWSGYANWNS